MFFHMNRIMSIWEGWREGQFPVRVYGRQLDGFGVPEGLFYPDVNLWLPALLYGAGVPIVTVYHLYWLGVTALAVFGGWFAFSRWTAAREAAPRELPTSGPLVYPHGVDDLYRGVDAAAVRASFGTPAVPQVSGRDVRLSGWRQRGTRFSFAVSAPDGAVVRLPLFFYPGYAARDEAGREVAVREGRDHLVEVLLPPGGTAVFGRYAGRPWFLWLDVLAVASWGAFAWGCWRRRRAGGSQGAF